MEKDIYQIRADNLNELRGRFSSNSVMANELGLTRQRLGQLLLGPERDTIGYKLARKIEEKLGLNRNHLDSNNPIDPRYLSLFVTMEELKVDPAKVMVMVEMMAEASNNRVQAIN